MNFRDMVARVLSALALVAVAFSAATLPRSAAAEGPDFSTIRISSAGQLVSFDDASAVAADPAPAAVYQVFLPGLSAGGGTTAPTTPTTAPTTPTTAPTTPTTAPTTPTPQPAPATGAFFLETEVKTISSVSRVDAQGRMHVVLNTFVSYSEDPKAIYGFCTSLVPAECLVGANWKFVELQSMSDGVELDLTSDGKPRVIVRHKDLSTLNTNYIYGECYSGCEDINNWSGAVVVNIAENPIFAADEPQRSFELDPQDRPRFVVGNGWGNGQPDGIFYLACDSACASGTNAWTKTSIYEGPEYRTLGIEYPSLAFTSDGRPRVVGMMTLSGLASGLLYFECDSGCDAQSGWDTLDFDPEARFASWDIEVDANDRLHVALGNKISLDPLPAGGHIEYRTCDTDCTIAGSWASGELPLQGQYPDLELDGQGRPRIAYGALNASGVAFAACNSNCLQGAGWTSALVDPASKLIEDFPVVNPITCDPSAWLQFTPSLALDAAGNPRIAYDALNGARCWYDHDNNPGTPDVYRIEKLFRAVRYVIAEG